jgi:hypothetical protein
MRQCRTAFFCALAAAAAVPVTAQESRGPATEIFLVKVRPGFEAKFEEGMKKHFAWHKRQGDTWNYSIWQIVSGPNFGKYLGVSAGHEWKDFDTWQAKFGKGDEADASETITPYTDEVSTSYWAVLPQISRPPDSREPGPMVELIHFRVKPEAEERFQRAMTRVHEAIQKSDWPYRYIWYSLVNGGEHPSFTLALPKNGFADLAEPETPFPKMLEKSLGRSEAESILKTLGESVREQTSELVRYRADLSYRGAASN